MPDPRPMVELSVDDALRRIYVTIRGAVAGPPVAQAVARMFLDRPELTAFDMLYDISAYTGSVEASDIEPIAVAYAACSPDPSIPTRTAFVTGDPNFRLWAEVMNFQFPGRTHAAFRDPADAVAFLDSTER